MEKLHAEKGDFEKQRWQVGEAKKLRKNQIFTNSLHSLNGEEDVTLVNNATLCMNTTRHDVAVWRGTAHKELLTIKP